MLFPDGELGWGPWQGQHWMFLWRKSKTQDTKRGSQTECTESLAITPTGKGMVLHHVLETLFRGPFNMQEA